MRSNLATAYQAYTEHVSADTLNELARAITDYALAGCGKRRIAKADAEEIAQETTMSVWQKLGSYDPTRSSFKTWVHRCTLDQVCIHRRRRQKHEKDVAGQLIRTPEKREVDPQLMRYLREATGDGRELIDLIAVLGSVCDAAYRLGITVTAANKRLARLASKINIDRCPETSC